MLWIIEGIELEVEGWMMDYIGHCMVFLVQDW